MTAAVQSCRATLPWRLPWRRPESAGVWIDQIVASGGLAIAAPISAVPISAVGMALGRYARPLRPSTLSSCGRSADRQAHARCLAPASPWRGMRLLPPCGRTEDALRTHCGPLRIQPCTARALPGLRAFHTALCTRGSSPRIKLESSSDLKPAPLRRPPVPRARPRVQTSLDSLWRCQDRRPCAPPRLTITRTHRVTPLLGQLGRTVAPLRQQPSQRPHPTKPTVTLLTKLALQSRPALLLAAPRVPAVRRPALAKALLPLFGPSPAQHTVYSRPPRCVHCTEHDTFDQRTATHHTVCSVRRFD